MKRAVISVFNKVGIGEFAAGLVKLGYDIISTGGTFRLLQEKGIAVTPLAEITGYPEILEGRVKSLHPKIHGGILAKNTPQHLSELADIDGFLIDLVAVNLYPFQAVTADPTTSFATAIENIDIGGPTLLRAAAKNHQRVIPICDPGDYRLVLSKLEDQGEIDTPLRQELAAKSFAHTAFYDSLIANYLGYPEFAPTKTIALEKQGELRYGENPHQMGAFYREVPANPGLAGAVQIQGKQLSFNNIMDGDAAWQMASAISECNMVAVKHSNPCGWAIADTLAEAFDRVYEGDPVSIFGGIIATNTSVDQQTANKLKDIFIEMVIAPDFSEEALAIFAKKPNLRVLKLAPMKSPSYDWKRVTGGFLLQEPDVSAVDDFQVVTEIKPTKSELADLKFAWLMVKYVKSNAIVVGSKGQLLGVGAGQMNRVQSMGIALTQAGEKSQGAVVASDAFFPFADNIEVAAKAQISAIIQPGGSRRDQEVIEACNRHKIAMVFTGERHFRH